MKINRVWSMPNKNTFEIKPVKELLISYLTKLKEGSLVVDPFANKGTIKNIGFDKELKYITNDLDEQYDTNYHLDALEFLKQFDDNSVDFVLFDPPFSPRQVSESYKKLGKTVNHQTTQASYWGNLKKEIGRILKKDGLCISCGWNSGGIGKKYSMEIQEILLIPHGDAHNDTIIVVDKKI